MQNQIYTPKDSDQGMFGDEQTGLAALKTWTTQEVAKGLKVTDRNIRKHISKLEEGVHYLRNSSSDGGIIYLIAQKGVEKLGKLVNTKQAKDFATTLAVSESMTDPTNPLFWQKLQQQQQIAMEYLQTALEREKQNTLKLESETVKLASRDLEVKTQKEYKWKNQELQNDRGRTINYYVNKYFFDGDYAAAHNLAKATYKADTGVILPNARQMSLEQKKAYLEWLSRYEPKNQLSYV